MNISINILASFFFKWKLHCELVSIGDYLGNVLRELYSKALVLACYSDYSWFKAALWYVGSAIIREFDFKTDLEILLNLVVARWQSPSLTPTLIKLHWRRWSGAVRTRWHRKKKDLLFWLSITWRRHCLWIPEIFTMRLSTKRPPLMVGSYAAVLNCSIEHTCCIYT